MNTIEEVIQYLLHSGFPWCAGCESKMTLDHVRIGNPALNIPEIARCYCEKCGKEREVSMKLGPETYKKWAPSTVVWNPRAKGGYEPPTNH